MIKIFSIKEIINASNDILKTTKIDKKNNQNFTKYVKKKIVNEKLAVPNSIEPLILKSEIKQNKLEIKSNKIITTEKSDNSKDSKVDNELIINELYKLFNKKIKKNTLKIIVEQQLEIKKINNNLAELRKNDFRNLKINKELKNKILDLTNKEKILNFKIYKIQENLNLSSTKIEKLKNINIKINNDNLELENSLSSIKLTKKNLENSNSRLQNKIDNLIDENNRLDKINNNNENDILILTNTKKYLFDENKKLQNELNLVNENREILIFNNKKLQKETSLLLKNKELLIEINDKYQNKVNELQLENNNYQNEKLILNNNILELKDENNKQIKTNENLENKNKELENGISLLNVDKQNVLKKNDQLMNQVSEFLNSENSFLQKIKELESNNNILKNKIETDRSDIDKVLLEDINKDLKTEIISLKNYEAVLIANNKKLNEELLQIKSLEVSSNQENDLKNLKQKLTFHQDENLRLSHELSNSQKRYKLIKGQLEEIEREKSNISQKIDDLTDSLSKTKVVTSFFQDTNDSNLNKESKNKINLEDQVKKIFSNIE